MTNLFLIEHVAFIHRNYKNKRHENDNSNSRGIKRSGSN